ncbi:MAG: response regulator [Anaerolineae bacterium]|nr:response regulator [Anaerolineae bacterium]
MAGHEKMVMVIEDDPEMVELLQLLLRRRAIQVVPILASEDGVAALEQLKPDLVLLDLMMPKVSGWDIYQYMQASPELCDIPIMILSVQTQKTSELHGQSYDAVAGYFTKPFRPQALLAQVDRCLGTHNSLEPATAA